MRLKMTGPTFFHSMVAAVLLAALIVAAPCTHAATPAPAVAAPSAAAAAPQRTTATFADWTVRCDHPTGAAQTCEIVQMITSQGQPVAQIALGRLARGEALHLTLLVPPNVTLAQAPHLTVAEKAAPAVDLAWRRCLPGGCIADATLSDDQVRQLRARTEAMRLVFLEATGKEASIPLSPQGLGQALDAMAHEDGA